jgi:arylsulfatase A-like enzyme
LIRSDFEISLWQMALLHSHFHPTMKPLLFLCLFGLFSLSRAAEPSAKPNILLILADDLGYSDLGCYGGEIPTPNLDALGTNGLRFTHMTNSARCCPTRASLLTGLHPSQAGIPNMGGTLANESATLAEVLKSAGYATYAIGKWHVGDVDPTARGFDEFYGYPSGYSADQWDPAQYSRLPTDRKPELQFAPGKFYATDAFNAYAKEFIRQVKSKDRPWFLYLAHSSPHFPVQAPMASAKPFLETYRQGWDRLRERRFARLREVGLIQHDGWKLSPRSMVPVEKDNSIANGFSGQQNPAWDSLDADRREDLAHRMALYAAMVKHLDDGIGEIVSQLKADGSYHNTLILFLSDNGACYEWGPFGFDGLSRDGTTTLHTDAALDAMGGPKTNMSYGSAWANLSNTPFRHYKHFAHEGGIVTPFLVHWPSGLRETGRWVRDPAHVMDIMPTLVQIAGAKYPETRDAHQVKPMEGVSLAPLFTSKTSLPERAICTQHEGARAIRKGRWKLVMGKRAPVESVWELYDILADPCEMNNLAATHSDLTANLASEWGDWTRRVGIKINSNNLKAAAK